MDMFFTRDVRCYSFKQKSHRDNVFKPWNLFTCKQSLKELFLDVSEQFCSKFDVLSEEKIVEVSFKY
jgi:hypothetical protein